MILISGLEEGHNFQLGGHIFKTFAIDTSTVVALLGSWEQEPPRNLSCLPISTSILTDTTVLAITCFGYKSLSYFANASARLSRGLKRLSQPFLTLCTDLMLLPGISGESFWKKLMCEEA